MFRPTRERSTWGGFIGAFLGMTKLAQLLHPKWTLFFLKLWKKTRLLSDDLERKCLRAATQPVRHSTSRTIRGDFISITALILSALASIHVSSTKNLGHFPPFTLRTHLLRFNIIRNYLNDPRVSVKSKRWSLRALILTIMSSTYT